MERLTQGRSGKVTLRVFDDLGELIAADAAPTVLVMDGAGAEVATGTATAESTGIYTFAVPATVTADLDTYTVLWDYSLSGDDVTDTTVFETCGAHLFTIAEARNADAALSDTVRFPSDDIARARVAAEQRFEKGAMLAFTPRAARETLSGKGREGLRLKHVEIREVFAVSINGVALTESELDDLTIEPERGELIHPQFWPYGDQNIDVFYSHGLDVCPAPVSEAVRILAVDALIPSSVPSRASMQYTDGGAFRLSIAGRDGETGIPDVDAIMQAFGRRRPSV